MEYNSFYGGRRGASFIIAEKFATINEMVAAFRQGGDYTTVNYDEYVIIDTENKNDDDNGKIYRRGYDITGPLGGAEYMGQIVGPAGRAPHLQLTTVDDVNTQWAQSGESDKRKGSGSYTPTVNLIPGKEGSTYHDSIEYAWCSIRNPNGTDTTAYIGFKIPYLVVDFSLNLITNPSYSTQAQYKNLATTEEIPNTHPFYKQWKINIPAGIQGKSIRNFRLYTPTTNTTYNYGAGGTITILANKTCLLYDIYNYNTNSAGSFEGTYCLGYYNDIKNVSMSTNGTITIQYTGDKADQSLANQVKWVTNFQITNTDQFKITYNDGTSTTFSPIINFIEQTAIPQSGTYKYHLLVRYSAVSQQGNITYNNITGWTDLGAVKANDGVLVGLNIDSTSQPTLDNISDAITYLNTQYPSGLTGNNLEGKIVSIGRPNVDKKCYAYNYNAGANTWFYLGTVSGDNNTASVIAGDSSVETQALDLPTGSLWFVVES